MTISTLISKQWKLALLIVFTLPFSYHCIDTPLSPVAPKWTTQLTVQLIKRTYYFKDMIRKDSAKFQIATTGELFYRPASQKNKPEPIKLPTLKPVSASLTQALGLIPIKAVNVPPIELPSFSGIPLVQKIIIDTTILIGDTSLYDYLKYEDGRMTLTVKNTMNINWTFVTPIEVFNSDINGNVFGKLGEFNIGLVPKGGGTGTDFFPIDTAQNGYMKMKFKLESEEPVPFPNTVIIDNGRLTFNFSITNSNGGDPSLSEAKMRLLSEYYLPVKDTTAIQKLDATDKDQTPDSTTFIHSATFKGGAFDIVINNGIPFDVIIAFYLREFVNVATQKSYQLKDENGAPKDSITIKGKTDYTEEILMKDYKLQARRVPVSVDDPGREDTLTSGMHFTLKIKTLVKSAAKVVIKKTDSVHVEIRPKESNGVIEPYVLDVVTGRIPPNKVAINDTIPAGVGQSNDNFSADTINFDGASIVLKIFTKSLFPTDLKFTVQAISNGVITDSLSTPVGTGHNTSADGVSFRIFPGEEANIIFDKSNKDAYGKTIDQFLSKFVQNGKFKFPDKFAVTGNAVIDPLDLYNIGTADTTNKGTVKDNDSVYTSLDFSFPLKIGIVNGLYLADTSDIAGNADTSMTSSIEEGTIGFNLASTFPVALDIYSNLIKADPADPTKPSRDTLTNSVIRFPDPNDSTEHPLGVPGTNTIEPKREYREIQLSSVEAKKVAEAKFTAVEIKLNTAGGYGGEPLAFEYGDSIQVITTANIKFKVDTDKFK
ncbi:MAG: hypothetical protein WCX28_13225 [Bacteriovoracaceae bacterium]|nr:hypothetical protein [Bacteroidota bacterium]